MFPTFTPKTFRDSPSYTPMVKISRTPKEVGDLIINSTGTLIVTENGAVPYVKDNR